MPKEVGGQAVLGRQSLVSTPWLTERHGYDPTLADIFGASIRTIQNWQEQGMPVLRGGGKGNEVLYDSAAVIKWYAERDAEIENEKLRREVEELRQASEADLQPGTIEYERH